MFPCVTKKIKKNLNYTITLKNIDIKCLALANMTLAFSLKYSLIYSVMNGQSQLLKSIKIFCGLLLCNQNLFTKKFN